MLPRLLIPITLASIACSGGKDLDVKTASLTTGVNVENDFGYQGYDIWYKRLGALETLATSSEDIDSEDLSDLRIIAAEDEDWRIRDLAQAIVTSYLQEGDFSLTEPYQRKQAAELRLRIDIDEDFGYNVKDIWFERLDALEALAERETRITPTLVMDLYEICQLEDDWRIRKLACQMGKSYED